MNASLIDGTGLLVAVIVGGVIVVLPGWGVARFFDVARTPGGSTNAMSGLLVGLSVLPLLVSLTIRFFGVDVALGADLACGFVAVAAGYRDRKAGTRGQRGVPRLGAGLLVTWFCLLAFVYVDFDTGHRLYQSFTIIDTVKHAATTQAIADSGAPPRDPFFLRPSHAGYYYFFYALPALAQRLCFGLIDAKAAFGGIAFWSGVGVFGLIDMVIARCGLSHPGTARRTKLLVAAVLASSGLDVLAVLFIAWRSGFWLPAPEWWNEQVTSWLETMFWVPHHLTALIAGMMGLVILSEPGSRRHPVLRASFAALCFASAFGLSIWVTLALVATTLFWVMVLSVERRWTLVGSIAAAGVVALLLACPQLLDLHSGRDGSGQIPIALTVRWFAPVDALLPGQPWNLIGRLVLLPINYLFEFGALGLGAILFWRRRHLFPAMGELGRVLNISAVVGLLLGGFLTSTLINNDLGMRVVLFPLLAATVWTVAVLDRAALPAPGAAMARHLPAVLSVALLIGYGTTGYLVFSLRFYRLLPLRPSLNFLLMDSATMHDLRGAYTWADTHLPPSDVLQHNPVGRRSLGFGLYSRNQVAVADPEANLFGANPAAVADRVGRLAAIFSRTMSNTEVRTIATANGISDLVVTAEDPVWAQPTSFVWTASAAYMSPNVRILSVSALKDRG